jgi:type IV pilus assembly protein PilA
LFSDPSSIVRSLSASLASPRHASHANASADDSGFSLIELLVVILIIGVLAAIAIPSFLNSKGKAVDSQAKEMARTAETTTETISTDSGGNYEKVNKIELNKTEPSIRITESPTDAYISAVTSSKTEYSITATATNGDEFTITKSASGLVSRACTSPVSKKGCAGGGEKSSW